MTNKQVTLRLPQATISHVARVAKVAGVSPTQVYNVMLAAFILSLERGAIRDAADETGKS